MATVIDALMVTLGLDGRQFTAGSKAANQALRETSDEAKKSAAEIEARAKQATMFFSKLRNEALALAAIFTAGLGVKNFVGDTISGAASLGLMAKNLNMSTESLSAWEKANQRAGGSAEGMLAQLKESAQELANVKMGRGSEAATEFYRMGGVDVRNFKDGNEFLLERSRILSDIYAKDPTKALVVAGRMGISEDTFNLLKQGPAAVMALVNAQRKNSQVTEEQAAKALQLSNRWLDFKDRIATVTTQIVLQLEPALERITMKLQGLADWIASHQDDIGRWLDKAVTAVTQFAGAVDDAAQSVGGWKVVLAGLLALKVASFAVGLISLATALGGVGTGLGLIGALGPAALAALAGLAVYKASELVPEASTDTSPATSAEKAAIKPTDPKAMPTLREIQLRTMASVGDAAAAKDLYKLTGRNEYPAVWTPEGGATPKQQEKYKRGEGGISEIIDRTLASLGNKNAAIRIKAATGVDDYGAGDAKLDDKPKARLGVAGGRGLIPLAAKGAQAPAAQPTPAAAGSDPWQIPPAVQAERDKDRLQILQDELSKATNKGDREALQREIARTQTSIATATARAKAPQSTPGAALNYMRAATPAAAPVHGGNTSTTEVNINGPISISAPAGDVDSIAAGFTGAVKAKMMAAQSNTGLD